MFSYYEADELLNTPSFKDGVDSKTEVRYRSEGVKYLRQLGKKKSLRYHTIATAVVFYHRFYMAHSFNKFPRFITATSCLFLAGKVEETPKRTNALLEAAWEIFSNEKAFLLRFGKNPRNEIIQCESVLMQTIDFVFEVEHPYKYLMKYAKYLIGNKFKIEKLLQMAWNFMNDSLRTTLCLQWEPEVVAIALLHLSTRMSSFEVVDWKDRLPEHTHWWDLFIEDINVEFLEDIENQVLGLYSDSKHLNAPQYPSPDSSNEAQKGSNASSPDSVSTISSDEKIMPNLNMQPVQQSPPTENFTTIIPAIDFTKPPPPRPFYDYPFLSCLPVPIYPHSSLMYLFHNPS